MSTVDLLTVRLTWAEVAEVRPAPHLLRGAVAALFPNDPAFHQHEGGRLLYRYPPVQYRWDRRGPALLGLGDGVCLLAGTEWAGRRLPLGGRVLTVREATCDFRRHQIRPVGRLLRYRLAA